MIVVIMVVMRVVAMMARGRAVSVGVINAT